MKTKLILIFGLFILLVPVSLLLGYGYNTSQHADYGWDIRLNGRTYTESHPRVVIDRDHHNAHTARGKYHPFAKLMDMDGCDVKSGKRSFSTKSLEGVDVLVIVNASGGGKPTLMGINIPLVGGKDNRAAAAFKPEEIEAVRAWVEGGGALLLIADHAPYGSSSEAMAAAFGVTMHKGFTEIPDEISDPMEFSRDNGRLPDHPIVAGSGEDTRVTRVLTFTGQSLDGPPGATQLLALPDSAVEYVPPAGDREGPVEMREEPAGAAQGLAFEYGAGRVVVLGEAAMLTAQVYRGEKFGMNTPGCDNQQFALNIVHWLTRTL